MRIKQSKITTDPRHKALKPYLNLLLELLKNLEPSRKAIEERHRLIPWVFEEEPIATTVWEEVQSSVVKESSKSLIKIDV